MFCLAAGPAAGEVEHVRTWIDRACTGCRPTIRVLSGNWLQGTPDEELERRVVERIESLLPYAVEKGVIVALENHGGGVTVTGEQLLRLVRAIKGPNFAVNLTTRGTSTALIRTTRSSPRRRPCAPSQYRSSRDPPQGTVEGAGADLPKVIGILREAKYSGYVVLEYNASEDPKIAVPRYLKTSLRSLIS